MLSLRCFAPVFAVSLMVCSYVRAQSQPAPQIASDRVSQLLSRMTLEEKAGQLAMWSGGIKPTGPEAAAGSEADIRLGRVGSFLGVWGAEATRRLQRIAVEESRMKLPLLFSADVI